MVVVATITVSDYTDWAKSHQIQLLALIVIIDIIVCQYTVTHGKKLALNLQI